LWYKNLVRTAPPVGVASPLPAKKRIALIAAFHFFNVPLGGKTAWVNSLAAVAICVLGL
jgi:hypothetical protein